MAKSGLLDFDAIRADTDFETVLAHYNLAPIGKGRQVKIHCPMGTHEDSNPSLSIQLDDGKFKCFGCPAKGNILGFIEQIEDYADKGTYRAAMMALEIMGLNADDYRKGSTRKAKAKNAPGRAAGAKTAAKPVSGPKTAQKRSGGASGGNKKPAKNPSIEGKVNLTLTHEHDFLESRGVTPKIAEEFGIGWCGTGIMKNRIAIPIHNLAGERVAYTGRWASDDTSDMPEEEGKYKLPKGYSKSLELFNIHRAAEFQMPFVVIVEGVWSTVRLHTAGVPCVGLLGTSLSDDQAELLVKAGFRHAILIMDGDDAGLAATPAILEVLCQHVYGKTIVLPEGEKPDTMSSDMVQRLIRK